MVSIASASVTVSGTQGSTVTLSYDKTANAFVAAQLADQISAGVSDGSISASSDPTKAPAPGTTGYFVATTPGDFAPASGYKDFTLNGPNVAVTSSGGLNQSVLIGADNDRFTAVSGSGTVVGGAGADTIDTSKASGNWTIALGGGNDSVDLGAGASSVRANGNDTINASTGAATINAVGTGKVLVKAGSGPLIFIGGAGHSTVIGGSGSETIFGGTGSFTGGAAGGNYLQAGSGTGTTTLVGASAGSDTFAFLQNNTGADLVVNFISGSDKVQLAAGQTTISQTIVAGSNVLKLNDGTTVTFQGLNTTLKPGDIV